MPSSQNRRAECARAKVLKAANARFEQLMRDRPYKDEESVLADVMPLGPASDLIRAVAQWRIAKRPARRKSK